MAGEGGRLSIAAALGNATILLIVRRRRSAGGGTPRCKIRGTSRVADVMLVAGAPGFWSHGGICHAVLRGPARGHLKIRAQ